MKTIYLKLTCQVTNILFPLLLILLITCCERNDRIFRPDLPEKLCCIGIIDIDDSTLRHISFEKSYQSEYQNDVDDSLRNFSFSIYSSEGEIFKYQCDSTIKRLKDFKIPDSIDFIPGQKYYLNAKENDLDEISAEIIAAPPPSDPFLISYEAYNTTLSEPAGCLNILDVRTLRIKISFEKSDELDYAILLSGSGGTFSSIWPGWPNNSLDFIVIDGNTPGFLAPLQGLVTYHNICFASHSYRNPTFAYFIQGNKILNQECQLTLAIQYRDGLSIFDSFLSIGIKLISIPHELFSFEKSMYTYSKVANDPFAEPVYINGNIKGGNGVFALCRSKELKITFQSPWI